MKLIRVVHHFLGHNKTKIGWWEKKLRKFRPVIFLERVLNKNKLTLGVVNDAKPYTVLADTTYLMRAQCKWTVTTRKNGIIPVETSPLITMATLLKWEQKSTTDF